MVGAGRAVAYSEAPGAHSGAEKLDNASHRWFALRVKARCEKAVATIAQNKGFEQFLPRYERRRRWSDRLKSVEFPLFPGYVFCRLNPQHRLPLLTIPGVLHFVGIGKVPAPIEDAEIAAIQSAVLSGLLLEPWPFLELGQRVRLEHGPLAGLEGVFVGDSKQERIVVSITLLQRSVAVAIERHWAQPVNGNHVRLSIPADSPPSPIRAEVLRGGVSPAYQGEPSGYATVPRPKEPACVE
jgi:transcription antitermination factor NusG